MTNAQLTDVFALADALLAAGWIKRRNEDYRDRSVTYPTHYCLFGAFKAAVAEVLGESAGWTEKEKEMVALAERLLAKDLSSASWRGLATFNDFQTTVEPVRDLIHQAADRLTK